MRFSQMIGQWFGLENVDTIEDASLTFGAHWAQQSPAWLFFGCLALSLVSLTFYFKFQKRAKIAPRIALTLIRAVLLCVLFLILADPVVSVKLVSHPRPLLWVLFDGTDSMGIEDELSDEERNTLEKAIGVGVTSINATELGAASSSQNGATTSPEGNVSPGTKLSRQAYIQSYIKRPSDNLLQELSKKYRLKAFRFDRADGVQALEVSKPGTEEIDLELLSNQLTTTGEVTAIGKSLEDLSSRHSSGNLAGVMMFSDFDQNTGPAALSPARRLGVPIYTVGIGPEAAVDIAVDLQAPLLMKKAERATLVALVRQTGLKGQSVTVKVQARKLGATALGADEVGIPVGEKTVTLEDQLLPVEFPFEPIDTGRFVFTASIDALPAEVVQQNNRSERESNIRDDFLRLMFVEYEPTWEWRFIKEVFHRDKLVGMRGFRTFLRSADPKVRETNELFLPTLTPKRSEFFANDVIFLGDMPAATLSTRFCEMTKEFVSTFGGGLVVMAGPRFGPGDLADTPLADMLPIVPDPDGRPSDGKEFQLKLTPEGLLEDFMQLGSTSAESDRGWDNMGKLPWYQPVAKVHPVGTTVLAVHPTDKTVDQKTPQPIIAVRRYGKGQVIYLGFNETWRLRRKYGELYYRQFWGQMIHRLGLSHALGSQKRFVVRTDRPQYQADDKVTLTVEAYDANFEPLNEETFPDKKLKAELYRPNRGIDEEASQPLTISQLREGVFEARLPVFASGEYRVVVNDPITKEPAEVFFQVTSVSAERRSAVRNVALQEQVAASTNGKSYTLETAHQVLNDFQPKPKTEVSIQTIEIWHTWFCFTLVVLLMLTEWFVRKWCHLP